MLFHKYRNRVIIDPKILAGKPIIRGTRIPVELVLKLLAQGDAVDEILEEYPRLTREDVLAVLDYAYGMAKGEEVYSLQFSRV